MSIEFSKKLAAHETPIPGVVLYDLRFTATTAAGSRRTGSGRRWSRWAAGLPSGAEQHLVQREGRHHPRHPRRALGQVHLRGHRQDIRRLGGPARRPDLRRRLHRELDPSQAIFIPRGVGNAFQTLEDNTAYTYLVNDHWSADAQGQYTFLNLADETAAIDWPVPLDAG